MLYDRIRILNPAILPSNPGNQGEDGNSDAIVVIIATLILQTINDSLVGGADPSLREVGLRAQNSGLIIFEKQESVLIADLLFEL